METILLVDDEYEILEGLKRNLRKEPYKLILATSGKEALDILENTRIDIIISDEMMPGMKGTELLSICKKKYPDTVRIILTGQGSLESAMNAIYDGWVYQYLQKPVNPKDLIAVIHVALILKSLQTADEAKHLVMNSELQSILLEKFGVKQESLPPSENSSDYENPKDWT